MKEDKFTNGLLAGMIAGFITNFWNYFSFYILKFTTLTYTDFAAFFIYGEKPKGVLEFIFAQMIQLFFTGFGGIIFAYLIPFIIEERWYRLKSLVYGISIWCFIIAITTVFKVPGLVKIPFRTALSSLIGASIFGILLAYAYRYVRINLK